MEKIEKETPVKTVELVELNEVQTEKVNKITREEALYKQKLEECNLRKADLIELILDKADISVETMKKIRSVNFKVQNEKLVLEYTLE